MYDFHPYFTADGSTGLYNPDFNDIYHSATGALTEAYEKFILPSNLDLLIKKNKISVLDICYGIGYNSKSFLNYFFEKFLLQTNNNISPIHTYNLFDFINDSKRLSTYNETIDVDNNSFFRPKSNLSTSYTEQIYNYNILPKISITAVDNDKILSYLSPFIKTGQKNIKNKHIDFEYKNIDKYLKSSKKIQKPKINNIINFLIFDKILESNSEILENDEVNRILTNSKYKDYFDRNMIGIYNTYRSSRLTSKATSGLSAFLHNIYYHHVSNGYKRDVNAFKLNDIIFNLKNDDARVVIKNDTKLYDLIFLDAFTPSKCPCLWSYEFFKLLYEHLEHDGMILTYSTSAAVRGAMIEAGFYIGGNYNHREKKILGTIAVKDKSLIKYPLSEFDLGLLKTTAGIFYRDENLTALNEAIIARRNIEVKNSTRISSSHYKKEVNNG